jgi:hypothetical protein
MDFVPFDTVGLSATDFDNFYQTYKALDQKFDIHPTGDIDFHLEDFESFRYYKDVHIRGSFVIKNAKTDCYILFIELGYTAPNTGRGPSINHKEYQVWALAYVKHNFGRVLIRPETLADKIIEIVHPIEIDFKEDKAFSDTFYVLANDTDKAIPGIDRSFRNAVMDVRHDHFTIEIFDHTLIIGDRKLITPERSVHLCEFVSRLCASC